MVPSNYHLLALVLAGCASAISAPPSLAGAAAHAVGSLIMIQCLFGQAAVASSQQTPLLGDAVKSADPTVTDSIKSIFSSFSQHGSKIPFGRPVTYTCCGAGCCQGCCNGHNALPPWFGTETALVHGSKTDEPFATSTCCDHTCSDGLCRFESLVPTPQPDQGGPTQDLRATISTNCGQPGGCQQEMTIIFPVPTAPGGIPITEAKPTAAPQRPNDSTDVTEKYYARDLAGQNQDSLPIIVEDSQQDPLTLLATLDLALTENYIASSVIHALGLSSKLTPIPAKSQHQVALGVDAVLVRPNYHITINLLAGSENRRFPGVVFSVFDPPHIHDDPVEPDVLLGVNFLRQAQALTLVKEYIGKGALEGLPVLVPVVAAVEKDDAGEGDKIKHGEL